MKNQNSDAKESKNAPFEIITTTLLYIFSFSGKGKVKVYDEKGILVSCKKDCAIVWMTLLRIPVK